MAAPSESSGGGGADADGSSYGYGSIPAREFYAEYHGHPVPHLRTLLPALRSSSDALIWTAGDSSLDNKYWFRDALPAPEGSPYGNLLHPVGGSRRCDVTYWLNRLSIERSGKNDNDETSYAAINAAVEATTLNERTRRLRPQDRFLRDNIRPNDVLIVSVGGNDIALAPAPCTILSVAGLLCLPTKCLEGARSFGSCPADDCCCGCGPSLGSCACSCPPCLGYFRHLFGTR